MEYKDFLKNISGTACVFGLGVFLSSAGFNSTPLVCDINMPMAKYSNYDETKSITSNNIYLQKEERTVEMEAEELFGIMRDATQEEQASVNDYISSIAVETGVNFFDLC